MRRAEAYEKLDKLEEALRGACAYIIVYYKAHRQCSRLR